MSENQHSRKRTPLTAKEKAILAAAAALLLLAAGVLGIRFYRQHRETVLFGQEHTADIYIAPDNTATRAAANYLAFSIERALGWEPAIVTAAEEGRQAVRILCGESPSADEEAPVCSLALEGDDLIIRVPRQEHCFEAVKAVTDRWLKEDCGLHRTGELRISWAMMERDLSWLPTAISGKIKLLSQNLCYSDDGHGKTVAERSKRFLQLVDEYEPDLIGIQEGGGAWDAPLRQGLSDRYELFGFPRSASDPAEGSWDAILYRKDRFTPVDGGLIWLSNTPTSPYTRLNFMGPYRLCNWVLLTDTETGKTLLYSNTHLQNGGDATTQEIRAREAEILLWQLRTDNKLASYPGFLTGDFNGSVGEPYYQQITAYYEDSRDTAVTNSSEVDYSYQGYGTAQWLIDFCFHSPRNVTVLDYRILTDTYGGYISDHYGLLVTAIVN